LARGLPRPEMLLGMAAQRLDDLGERLKLRSPSELVRLQSERLAARGQRLEELMRDRVGRADADLCCQADRLVPALVASRIELLRPRLLREAKGLGTALAALLQRKAELLDGRARQLEALSHTRVLERGYAIVKGKAGGHVLPRLAAVGTESELTVVFVDGELEVRRADQPVRAKTRAAHKSGEHEAEQGRLL
jgi:exodeoxyribonuclease VII large subunit